MSSRKAQARSRGGRSREGRSRKGLSRKKMVYSRLGRKMSPLIMGKKKLKKGSLTKLGYQMRSPVTSRHRALRKSVDKYGKTSTIWKLNLQKTYRKRSDPNLAKSIEKDIAFVRKI